MDTLHKLSSADLSALTTALESGRLEGPFNEVAVRRCCGGQLVTEIARDLGSLASAGMTARQMAIVLQAIAVSRTAQIGTNEIAELVWTGPESPGVMNRDTGVVVRELFGAATTDVLIAGFAVYQGKEVFRRLAERMLEIPDLRVRFVLDIRRGQNDTTLSSELIRRFLHRFRTSEWPDVKLPELFYDPRSLDEKQEKRSSMHAKCIVVDRRISFVTSANFTEAAQERNIEVGALIKSTAFASDLHRQFDLLVEVNALVRVLVPSG